MLHRQASLFASWFTYGFNGMFWLYLNKSRLFASPMKSFLTVVNFGMIAVAATIVSLDLPSTADMKLMNI